MKKKLPLMKFLTIIKHVFGITIAVSVGCVTYQLAPISSHFASQLSSIASATITLLGFIIAAITILMSIDDRLLIKRMKQSGHYKNLINSMSYTAVLMFITTVFAFVSSFMQGEFHLMSTAITVAITTLAFLVFARTCYKLWRVMITLSSQQNT